MQAHPGDQLVIKGRRMGQPDRRGEVLEARGPDETAPFLVRWDDTGHVTVLYPGTDCVVRHLEHHTSASPASGADRADTDQGGSR
jgi:hypothetical protein